MKNNFHKHRLTHAVAAAILGTTASFGMSSAQANGLVWGVNNSLTNDADPAEVHVQGVQPNSFRIGAGETDISFSGYVKADAIYDFENDIGDTFGVSSIPTDGSDDGGHFRIHARQSRLAIRSETDTGSSKLKTHIEGDFFSSIGNEILSNSDAFRLRHAYLTVGGWTVGQIWTNFMDFIAYPGTVDFFGPVGKSFIRQPQVRYTFSNGVSLSIENPETTGTSANGDTIPESLGGIGSDQLPDFVGAWLGGPGGAAGKYRASVVVRSLGITGPNEATVTGVGVNLAGAWDFGFGKVTASFTTGEGIGRYIINGVNNDIFVDANGDVEAVESTSATISYLQRWSDTATSLVALGFFDNDEVSGNSNDSLRSLHINYMWNPTPKLNYGAELIFGNNDQTDGSSGDAVRLQFAAQLNF